MSDEIAERIAQLKDDVIRFGGRVMWTSAPARFGLDAQPGSVARIEFVEGSDGGPICWIDRRLPEAARLAVLEDMWQVILTGEPGQGVPWSYSDRIGVGGRRFVVRYVDYLFGSE